MAEKKDNKDEYSGLPEEKKLKIKHNEEVHEKMKKEEPGLLGDMYVVHHESRCRG